MMIPVLYVQDVQRSLDFYQQALGFGSLGSLPGPDGKPSFADVYLGESVKFWVTTTPTAGLEAPSLDLQGKGVEFHINLTPGQDDIDALYAKATGAGAQAILPIMDAWWGERRFAVLDPDGYYISFNVQNRDVSVEEMEAISTGAAPSA